MLSSDMEHPFDTHYKSNRAPQSPPTVLPFTPQTSRRPSEPSIGPSHPQLPGRSRYLSESQLNPSGPYPHLLLQQQQEKQLPSHRPPFQSNNGNRKADTSLSIQAYHGTDDFQGPPMSNGSIPPHSPPPPPPQPNHDSNHHRSDHESVYRRILKHFENPWRNSLRRFQVPHRHQEQHQEKHHQPPDQSRQALMSTSTVASSADSTKSHCCFKYAIPIALLITSVAALTISGYLLYKYHVDSSCRSDEKPMVRGLHFGDCRAAVMDNCKRTDNKECKRLWDDCYGKTRKWLPSAHIRVVRQNESGLLGFAKSDANHPPTYNNNIFTTSSGLQVIFPGRYYVYHSITAAWSKKLRTFSVQLRSVLGKRQTLLMSSEHTWCQNCQTERVTLYNGGIFQLEKNAIINVKVSSAKEVTSYSFLGMFLV